MRSVEYEAELHEKRKAEMKLKRLAERRKEQATRMNRNTRKRDAKNKSLAKDKQLQEIQLKILDRLLDHAIDYVQQKGNISEKETSHLHVNMLRVLGGEVKAIKDFTDLREFLKDAKIVSDLKNEDLYDDEPSEEEQIIQEALTAIQNELKVVK